MSFQVFSTVLRSAAGCFGGPTASWMASMMPKMRPLLRFGPRPPGFRPLRAAAMSYVPGDRRQDAADYSQILKVSIEGSKTGSHLLHSWFFAVKFPCFLPPGLHQSPGHVPPLLIHGSTAKSHCNQITLEQCLRSVSSFPRVSLPVLVVLLRPSDLMLLRVWTHGSTVLLFLGAQFMDVQKELKQVLLFDGERFGKSGWQ